MWVWIRSHKTFVTGVLVFAIGLSVCVSTLVQLRGIILYAVNSGGVAWAVDYLLGADTGYVKILVAGLAGIVLGGTIALTSVLAWQRTWERPKVAIAPMLTVLGVVILTLSVFGFVQSSTELEELRAKCRYIYTCRGWDTQQLFHSLSAVGLVAGGSSVAAGLFLLARRRGERHHDRW